MRVDLSPQERAEFLRQLYSAFETGFDFEDFLKVFLQKIGFDEVEVTRHSRDGGIDLTALRRGVEGLSNLDDIPYAIQAKRLRPGTRVSIKDVRELRGVMHNGDKGMFITTGKFSQEAESFSRIDSLRPIILVNGEDLVTMCIEHELGFVPRPEFSLEKLRQIAGINNPTGENGKSKGGNTAATKSGVPKVVSHNDIRARILPLPSSIAREIPDNATSIAIQVLPDFELRNYPFNRNRRFVSGITEMFRHFGLLMPTGEFVPKTGYWDYNPESKTVTLEFV